MTVEKRRFQACASIFAMALIFGGTALVGAGMVATPSAEPGVRVTGAFMVAVCGFLARNALRAGVWIEEDGVTIRHWVRSRHLRWQDIAGFSVGGGTNLLQPTHTLHVHLADGRDVRVQEMSASALIHRGTSFVHEAVEALEAERRQRAVPGSSP